MLFVVFRRAFCAASAVAFASMTGACAFTPAELELKPNVAVKPSQVGSDTTLAFKFSDERDELTIGHRSVATVGAKITSEKLPDTFRKELRHILTKKGYHLVKENDKADARIIYRLRSFKFTIESGFFTGGRDASGALAVDADRNGKIYTTVYRTSSEQRILFVPGESEINQQMNAALNQILSKAANDQVLDQFLTAR